MAKFCTQCGKPLQEGEVCNCRQNIVPPASAPKMESVENEGAAQLVSVQNENEQSGSGKINQAAQSGANGMDQAGQPGANGGNPQYRQPGANGGNTQYRQPGANGGNPQYRQPGPNGGNTQYRQPGPNGGNTQYRQPGPNGGNTQYRQPGPNGGNTQYRQPGPNGMNRQYHQPQGSPVNMNEIGNKAKNIFGDMLESIKKPVGYVRVLTRRAYSKAGMEMIIFKGILSIIVTILCTLSISMMVKSVISSAMGGWSSLFESSGYNYDIDLPWFQLILAVAVYTFGADFLEALWLKLLTRTNKSYMVMTVNVGVRCAFDSLVIVIWGVFIILACLVKSPFMLIPAVIALVVYGICMPYIQFACYNAVLNDDPDSKVRRYILAKVLQGICMFIISLIFGTTIIETIESFTRIF